MSSVFVHQEDDDRQGTDEDSIYRSAKSYYTLTNLHTCQLPDETDSRQISDPLEFDDEQSLSKEVFDWIFNDVNRFIFVPMLKQHDNYVRCRLIRQRANPVESIRLLVENDLDGTRVPLLLAEKEEKTFGQSRYLIRVISDRTEDFGSAELISNTITGTDYTLYSLVNDHRQKLANIQYDTNIVGFNGPRKLHATLPNFVELQNRTPYWDSLIGSYALNFDGRRRPAISSVKNFQMIVKNGEDEDPPSEKNVLQFCRAAEDHFVVDFRSPLSLIQTFGICLTSLESRWCRE